MTVGGSAVTLTLASAVTWGQTVTVGYSVPGSNPVADDAGNSAAALSSRSVTNDTPSVPTFTLVGANPFGFSDVGSRSFPVLADLDGDGDLDALVGEHSTGNVLFFLNTGTFTAPTFSLDSSTNPFNFDNLSSTSHPALADLDGDGDLDALIGSNGGTTDFYRNIGTTASPTFSREASDPSTTAYTVTAGGGTVAVTAADANGGAVTLTLAGAVSAGQIVTVDYTAGGSTVQDVAGNAAAALSSQSVTNNTASPVVDNSGGATTTTEPTAPSSPGTTTIDGLTVTTTQSTNTDGTTTLTTNIPVVAVDRAEQLGASGLADIPLVVSGGVTQLQTQLPVGVGMQVETIGGSGAM